MEEENKTPNMSLFLADGGEDNIEQPKKKRKRSNDSSEFPELRKKARAMSSCYINIEIQTSTLERMDQRTRVSE